MEHSVYLLLLALLLAQPSNATLPTPSFPSSITIPTTISPTMQTTSGTNVQLWRFNTTHINLSNLALNPTQCNYTIPTVNLTSSINISKDTATLLPKSQSSTNCCPLAITLGAILGLVYTIVKIIHECVSVYKKHKSNDNDDVDNALELGIAKVIAGYGSTNSRGDGAR